MLLDLLNKHFWGPAMTSIDESSNRKWKVFVDDNFHYMDERERYLLGEFDSRVEAVAVCKKMVDDFLSSQFKPGMTTERLFQHYSSFGLDPFIVEDEPNSKFSAWDYARQVCRTMCVPSSESKTPLPVLKAIPGRVSFAPSSMVVSEIRPRKRQSGEKNYTGNRRFFDWESRPAVMLAGRAWAIFEPGGDWAPVHGAELADSGRLLLGGEEELRGIFADWGPLPPSPSPVRDLPHENFVKPVSEIFSSLSADELQSVVMTGVAIAQLDAREKRKVATSPHLQGELPNSISYGDAKYPAALPNAALETLADIANSLALIASSKRSDSSQRTSLARSEGLSPKDRLREINDDWEYFYAQCVDTARALEVELSTELLSLLGKHSSEILSLADVKEFSGEALSACFLEWFRLFVTTPQYVRKNASHFTTAFEHLIRSHNSAQLVGMQEIQTRFLDWTLTPHPDSRALITADIVHMPKGHSKREGSIWKLLVEDFGMIRRNWKSRIFLTTYIVIMHSFWIASLASSWKYLNWYELWTYAAFQYFYASIWPVFILIDLLGLIF